MKTFIVNLLTLAALAGCKGKAGISGRSQTDDNSVASSEEYAGTGPASAVSGTNLLPVCEVTSKAVGDSTSFFDCEIGVCAAKVCKNLDLGEVASGVTWRWVVNKKDGASLADLANCRSVASGVRYVCENFSPSLYQMALLVKDKVSGTFLEKTVGAMSIEEIQPKIVYLNSNPLPSLVIKGRGFAKRSSDMVLSFGGKSCKIGADGTSTQFTCEVQSGMRPGNIKPLLETFPSDTVTSAQQLFSSIEISFVSGPVPTPTPSPQTPTPTPTSAPSQYYIFTSSVSYDFTNPDSFCQNRGALSPCPSCTWKALVSLSSAAMNARVLVDKPIYKWTANSLSSTSLVAPANLLFTPSSVADIDRSETGVFLNRTVLTGSDKFGNSLGTNCADFTNNSGVSNGVAGSSTASASEQLFQVIGSPPTCDSPMSLYCISQ